MTSVAVRSVFAIHDDDNVRDWCNHQVAASIPTTFNSVADFETFMIAKALKGIESGTQPTDPNYLTRP
jgi:hypothetical protein